MLKNMNANFRITYKEISVNLYNKVAFVNISYMN